MDRCFSFSVSEEEAGISAERFLRKRHFPARVLTRLRKSTDYVRISKRPSRLVDLLSAGDLLEIRIPEEVSSVHIEPVCLPLDIVYEDQDILVINKPAGMPIHPSMENHTNSLASGLAWYFKEQRETFVFRCSNRLDRDTSGLTVVAKNCLSGAILSEMGRRHEIKREYLAVVRSRPEPPEGTICAPLGRKSGSIIERTVDFEHGEAAVTHYRTLEEKNGYSLVSLRLETGRTHQIRIHLKYLGYPLIGDYLYNPDYEKISRQALHSAKLSFAHPVTGEEMSFCAPLPEDMRSVFDQED